MRKSIMTLIFLSLGFIQFSCIPENTQPQPESLTLVDSFFNNHINDRKLGGAVVLVSKGGNIQHLKTYGYKNIQDSIKMDKDVLIPIASMTKVITSIAVLQLQEKGALDIDDPIEKYIPEFENVKVLEKEDSSATVDLKVKPTIKDLLRHTSGMVYSGGKSFADEQYRKAGFRTWTNSLDSFVRKLCEIPLAFQPNQAWRYSYSHDVLGYLIETVSEKRLNDYCMENIFKPLGMEDTDFYVPKSKSKNLSNLYEFKDEKLWIKDYRDSSIYNVLPYPISGGGGWWDSYGGVVTSIENFHIICSTLLQYGKYNKVQILTENSVKSMISNQIGDLDAFGNKYGLGVGVKRSKENHDGTEEIFWAGAPYNTYFWIDYKDQITGILFTNTAPFGHLGMMNKFKELTEKEFNP